MPPYAEDETEAVFWTGTMDWGYSTYVPLPADGASDLKEGLEVRKIPGDVAVVVGLELEFVDPPAVVAAAVTDEELLCPLTLTNHPGAATQQFFSSTPGELEPVIIQHHQFR